MYLILDTNILLLDANNIFILSKMYNNATIVLPETILDEIDSKKSGYSEVAYQARQFGRLLAKAETENSEVYSVCTTNYLNLDGVPIQILSFSHYPDSTVATNSALTNDRKILFATEFFQRSHKKVLFISNDVMCRLRAQSLGLSVSDHKIVENVDLEFTKSLVVSPEVFKHLHNNVITQVDPEYRPENYNYMFINSITEQKKLATISNNLIQVIGKETEKELRKQDVKPINSGHLFLAKAIQDTNVDIVICEAKAGSGKTVSAISNAISLVRRNKYESIIYIRASVDDVDSAEEIGFLSGNEEKFQVYLHPLEDALNFVAQSRFKSSNLKNEDLDNKVQEEVKKVKAKCNIQAMIGLGMRGRTYRNSIIIIDEIANQSKPSLQKMLTRVGDNCKVILIGSNNQIDNPFLNKYTNGLSTILDACRYKHDKVQLHAVSLPKIVRGHIAEFAETIFSKN